MESTEGRNSIELKGALRPFSVRRTDAVAPAGLNLHDTLIAAGWGDILKHGHVLVFIDDKLIPRDKWQVTFPRDGQTVYVRVVPMGGGGGGGKDPLRTVLMIVIVIVAVYIGNVYGAALAEGMFGAGASAGTISAVSAGLTATVMVAGTLALNAFMPPTMPSLSGAGGRAGLTGNSSPTYSIQGARNSARKYMPIPKIFGKHRVWPGYGAKPYTEIIGDDEYLRMVFIIGYGRLDISDMKIGETAISNFSGVSTNVREGTVGQSGLSLYPNQVDTEVLNLELTLASGWQTRTTSLNTDEITFDLYFARMFVVLQNNTEPYTTLKAAGNNVQQGDMWETSVQIEVQYRAVGAGSWSSWATYTITANSQTPIRRGYRKTVSNGQYEIRWRRLTADNTENTYDASVLVAVRSITYGSPIVEPSPLCTVELRIKATDQLNGVIDQFNCIAQSYLPVYDGASWTDTLTRNPAWAYAEVLRGAGNHRAIADSKVDAATLKTWADNCDSEGLKFDAAVDYQTTVFELLKEIASTGRGAFSIIDSQYGIIEDRPKTVPAQMISPRNSWGFKGKKIFADPKPHAFRARFINEEQGYQQDEMTVYDDGYDENTATLFETYDVFGIVTPDNVWKHLRYMIAAARLRPEFYTVWMDVEHLICTRGDLVIFQNDIPLIGVGVAARIIGTTIVSGDVTAIEIDAGIPVTSGESYMVKIRCVDNTYQTPTFHAGTTEDATILSFATPISSGTLPDVGDLMALYELATEETLMLIVGIDPGPDFSAELTMIDYNAAVYTADQGTIPAWTSNITRPANYEVSAPPKPTIDSVVSDETVLVKEIDGTLQSQIQARFSWEPGDWDGGKVMFQLQFRLTNGGDWKSMPPIPSGSRTGYCWPVQDRMDYDLRVRAVTEFGIASDWTTELNHAVTGKTSNPPDVPVFQIEGTKLVWSYPDAPLDLEGFEIRYNFGTNRAWSPAIVIFEGAESITEYDFGASLFGNVTFLIKAKDTGGRYSDNPAIILLALGDIPTSNILNTYEFDPLFPGTITGGAINGAQLEADELSLMWTTDSNTMWNANSDLMWGAAYDNLVYDFTFTPTASETGSKMLLDAAVTGETINYYYRNPGMAPMWNSDSATMWNADDTVDMWTAIAWLGWPGVLENILAQTYEFRIDVSASSIQGIIGQCDVVVDVDDIEETFQDVAIDSGGTRLSPTESYRVIKNVILTLQDDTGTAFTAHAMDKDATLGPLVKCYDKNGAAVSGTIDARIQGY